MKADNSGINLDAGGIFFSCTLHQGVHALSFKSGQIPYDIVK